jgi:hypothetical protein
MGGSGMSTRWAGETHPTDFRDGPNTSSVCTRKPLAYHLGPTTSLELFFVEVNPVADEMASLLVSSSQP